MTEISLKISDDNLSPGFRKNDVIIVDVSCVLEQPAKVVQVTDKIVLILSALQTIQCRLLSTHRAL